MDSNKLADGTEFNEKEFVDLLEKANEYVEREAEEKRKWEQEIVNRCRINQRLDFGSRQQAIDFLKGMVNILTSINDRETYTFTFPLIKKELPRMIPAGHPPAMPELTTFTVSWR